VAERAAAQAERLRSLASSLAGALTPADVLRAAIAEGAAAVGAHRGVVAELLPDGESLRLEVGRALSPSLEGTWRRFQLSARSPVSEAVRTGEPVFVESREALAAAYPEVALPAALLDMAAFAVLPLAVRGRRVGALGFTFAAPRRFEANERALLAAIAQQCAQALDRARLYDEADEARAAAEAEGRRAEEANRAKTQFLSTMSHELRTPLNAIGGHAQLIEMGLHGPVTEGQRDALSRIVRAQQHLLGLINDILNLARIEADGWSTT
jgi:signal transduction histidine kinase